jgi:hypothetical protein
MSAAQEDLSFSQERMLPVDAFAALADLPLMMLCSCRSNASQSKEPSVRHGIQRSVAATDRHFQLGKSSPANTLGSNIFTPSEIRAA